MKLLSKIIIVVLLAAALWFTLTCVSLCRDMQTAQNYKPEYKPTIKEKEATPEEKAYWEAKTKKQEEQQTQQQKRLVNDGYSQTLTKSGGVVYFNGLRETYYSSRVALHYRINEWWCDDNGFWRTQDGYFVVAYTMSLPIGTIINISQGQAMVLDHCPTEGTVDVYVCW